MSATRLPYESRRYLETVPDSWRLMPAEYFPGKIVQDLKAGGFIRIKRERPAPAAPYRYHLKRTNEGRAAIGLEPVAAGVDQ